MPRLRRLSSNDVLRILRRFGFEVATQRGSHAKLVRISPAGEKQILIPPSRYLTSQSWMTVRANPSTRITADGASPASTRLTACLFPD